MKSLKKLFLGFFALNLLMMTFATIAVAQSPSPAPIVAPADPNAVVGLLPVLISFVHNGQYLLAGAIITLIVCFILNQYILPKLNIGSGLVPILSSVIGVLSGVGLAVGNGAALLPAALAVLSGPVATHLYELVFQYFISKAPDAAPKA